MLSNPFYQIPITSDFIRKVILFFNNWSFLMKKDIHLVPSKLFAYPLTFSSIILNALLNFIIFVSNEVFKIFFPLGNLGRYHYQYPHCVCQLSIYLEEWNLCFLISVSPNVKISLFIFQTIHYKNIYVIFLPCENLSCILLAFLCLFLELFVIFIIFCFCFRFTEW